MENFSIEVSQVAHDKNKDGLDDTDVIGESGNKAGQEAPNNAYQRTSKGHHKEGGKTRQNIRVFDIILAHTHVGVEHVVQHLNRSNQTFNG